MRNSFFLPSSIFTTGAKTRAFILLQIDITVCLEIKFMTIRFRQLDNGYLFQNQSHFVSARDEECFLRFQFLYRIEFTCHFLHKKSSSHECIYIVIQFSILCYLLSKVLYWTATIKSAQSEQKMTCTDIFKNKIKHLKFEFF